MFSVQTEQTKNHNESSLVDDGVSVAFERHWEAIVRHATGLVRDRAHAEDLAQEAFVRLWQADQAGRWPDRPERWLSTVVTNLAITGFRRQSTATRRTLDLARQEAARRSFADDPSEAATKREAVAAAVRAMHDLTIDSRDAVVLAGAGYSAREIGHRIGRSPGAVRVLVSRGRRRLRTAARLELAAGA
jgi:RNA polymerase sigma-70 factor (ECF subfamily)